MKFIQILFVTFFLLNISLFCQIRREAALPKNDRQNNDTLSKDTLKKKIYCNFFCVGAGQLFSKNTPGLLQIKFPYTIIDQSGNTSSQTFISNSLSPSKKNRQIISLNLEIGGLKHAFNIQGGADSYSAAYFGFGYGYNIFIKFFNKSNNIIIQPSVNFCYGQFHGDLGSIDNENKDLKVLGSDANSTYILTWGKPQTPHTENAKTLDITYIQNFWTILPKLSFRNNHYKHTIHLEFDLGYYFPLYKKEGIELEQDNVHSITQTKITGFDTNSSLITTYNHKIVTSTPINFSGLYLGVVVGVNINYKNSRPRIKMLGKKS